jgi:hypothetical protein
MPPRRSPSELLRLSVSEEERQLERFCKSDELELGGSRKRFGDVPAIESPRKRM